MEGKGGEGLLLGALLVKSERLEIESSKFPCSSKKFSSKSNLPLLFCGFAHLGDDGFVEITRSRTKSLGGLLLAGNRFLQPSDSGDDDRFCLLLGTLARTILLESALERSHLLREIGKLMEAFNFLLHHWLLGIFHGSLTATGTALGRGGSGRSSERVGCYGLVGRYRGFPPFLDFLEHAGTGVGAGLIVVSSTTAEPHSTLLTVRREEVAILSICRSCKVTVSERIGGTGALSLHDLRSSAWSGERVSARSRLMTQKTAGIRLDRIGKRIDRGSSFGGDSIPVLVRIRAVGLEEIRSRCRVLLTIAGSPLFRINRGIVKRISHGQIRSRWSLLVRKGSPIEAIHFKPLVADAAVDGQAVVFVPVSG